MLNFLLLAYIKQNIETKLMVQFTIKLCLFDILSFSIRVDIIINVTFKLFQILFVVFDLKRKLKRNVIEKITFLVM